MPLLHRNTAAVPKTRPQNSTKSSFAREGLPSTPRGRGDCTRAALDFVCNCDSMEIPWRVWRLNLQGNQHQTSKTHPIMKQQEPLSDSAILYCWRRSCCSRSNVIIMEIRHLTSSQPPHSACVSTRVRVRYTAPRPPEGVLCSLGAPVACSRKGGFIISAASAPWTAYLLAD